jgi:hypothetical protein
MGGRRNNHHAETAVSGVAVIPAGTLQTSVATRAAG